MLGVSRLMFLTLCFVSVSRARLSVTVMDRDYNNVKPNDVLVTHIRRVLDSMGGLRVTLHPRVRHLYELLRRDAHLRSDTDGSLRHEQSLRGDYAAVDKSHVLDYHKTLPPKYDAYKLNRIFTTSANY